MAVELSRLRGQTLFPGTPLHKPFTLQEIERFDSSLQQTHRKSAKLDLVDDLNRLAATNPHLAAGSNRESFMQAVIQLKKTKETADAALIVLGVTDVTIAPALFIVGLVGLACGKYAAGGPILAAFFFLATATYGLYKHTTISVAEVQAEMAKKTAESTVTSDGPSITAASSS